MIDYLLWINNYQLIYINLLLTNKLVLIITINNYLQLYIDYYSLLLITIKY
jgi:hypothetical protein